MKTCNLLLAGLLLVLGFAVAASAMDKDEAAHGPTVYVPESTSPALVVGQDCTQPIVISSLPYHVLGQTTCGMGNSYANTCLGLYDGGEDIIYRLDLTAEATIDIRMNPYTSGYTGILLDDNCPPDVSGCIAFNTGSGGIRSILNKTLAAGSYYIMVDTWPTPNCIPQFALDITAAVPPPANDVCTGAIDLQSFESNSFQVDLCTGYTDNYNAGGTTGCTGYTSAGIDATYKIYLQVGENFTVSVQGTHDSAIWLVTDCANAAATCVAGADDTVGGQIETFSYAAAASGWYYLIVDGYSGCGLATVTIDAPVANEYQQWGGVKAMFK
ncbi:MAG: hypothetical protein Q7W56_01710 [Candidatus Latescibacteria bacterium]|nr:hypothetical protein [Candidatus Latescibacterota bacterium]